MKSVIAQGSTVSKAIEEALKKANMPAEFFIKLLEDAQGGFLGFGAKKAKIALFFKEHTSRDKKENILSQNSYENLFNSQSIKHQIEQQLKDITPPKIHPKQPAQNQPKQQNRQEPKPQTQKQHNPNFKPRNRSHFQNQQRNNSTAPTEQSTQNKITVRPLPTKKNDQSN
ncbi:Jag N-terminal domain-containing protein [Candidatus Babeliales bacterium]|nr:Jag N-terminal domain-containing protein [Candidatus Babeliales bacterium]